MEQFTVAATVLRLKSGLKESSFKRARTELTEKGYIDYKSRPNNQAHFTGWYSWRTMTIIIRVT
ncbi:hypothetical protein [Oceanobacillus arenosus]|uniref:hypothetical protein n=1 Tax=Oceanobacillus arenosus TaxID=1229153 RepID=UPI0011C0403C|nr:hypothetical protein [Oceanobacillus arenosus]